MSKQTQPKQSPAVSTQSGGPHAVSGRYVKLERGGKNNSLVRAEVVTLQAGHVVLVEELHPLDSSAISMEYAQRELWDGVSGSRRP